MISGMTDCRDSRELLVAVFHGTEHCNPTSASRVTIGPIQPFRSQIIAIPPTISAVNAHF